jgi:hypothetical protein
MFEITFIIIFAQDGCRALDGAVFKELLEIIEVLIDGGAKIDDQHRAVCKLFNILIIDFILFIDECHHCYYSYIVE